MQWRPMDPSEGSPCAKCLVVILPEHASSGVAACHDAPGDSQAQPGSTHPLACFVDEAGKKKKRVDESSSTVDTLR